MDNIKNDIILISCGDQYEKNNLNDINKKFQTPFKCDTFYIGKILNNYHYIYERPFDYFKNYRFYIHDIKLFNYDNKNIIYVLVSENNIIVKEIDNNFLIKESEICFKYINFVLWRIENVNNLIYDKNKFKLIIFFNFPLIYEFDDINENDLLYQRYKPSSEYSQIVLKKINTIYLKDIFELNNNIRHDRCRFIN
jgi:hypothetical protein